MRVKQTKERRLEGEGCAQVFAKEEIHWMCGEVTPIDRERVKERERTERMQERRDSPPGVRGSRPSPVAVHLVDLVLANETSVEELTKRTSE